MTRVRAVGWRLANRFGGPALRAWSLNDQYRRGQWTCLGQGRRPQVTSLAEELAGGGYIVELGCGEGHLIRALDPSSYQRYLGLDISAVAIETARRSAPDGCQFEAADLTSWDGTEGANLIISEESLYYLRPAARARVLDTASRSLAPGGTILVTFSDRRRHQPVIDQCCELVPHHTIVDGPGPSLFLILRPQRQQPNQPTRRHSTSRQT